MNVEFNDVAAVRGCDFGTTCANMSTKLKGATSPYAVMAWIMEEDWPTFWEELKTHSERFKR